MRPSGAHCDLTLADEVQRCTLRSDPGEEDWREAWRRELARSLAKGICEKLGEEDWRGGGRGGGRGEGILIKSSNPTWQVGNAMAHLGLIELIEAACNQPTATKLPYVLDTDCNPSRMPAMRS